MVDRLCTFFPHQMPRTLPILTHWRIWAQCATLSIISMIRRTSSPGTSLGRSWTKVKFSSITWLNATATNKQAIRDRSAARATIVAYKAPKTKSARWIGRRRLKRITSASTTSTSPTSHYPNKPIQSSHLRNNIIGRINRFCRILRMEKPQSTKQYQARISYSKRHLTRATIKNPNWDWSHRLTRSIRNPWCHSHRPR